MDQARQASVDFEVTELTMKIGELFNKFVAGEDVRTDQSVYISANQNAHEYRYRMQRATDIIFEMLCFHIATMKVNGATFSTENIKELIETVVTRTDDLAREMEIEKNECLDQMQ